MNCNFIKANSRSTKISFNRFSNSIFFEKSKYLRLFLNEDKIKFKLLVEYFLLKTSISVLLSSKLVILCLDKIFAIVSGIKLFINE